MSYDLAGGKGIRVAVVLTDPIILSGFTNYHESQSKIIAIYGNGFTNEDDVKITIRPSSPGSYLVSGTFYSLYSIYSIYTIYTI